MKIQLRRLLKFDFDLSNQFRLKSLHSPCWRWAVIISHSGDSWLWAAGAGLVWLFSWELPALHRFAAIVAVSIVFQALFVFALKQFIHRPRPNGDWGGIYRLYDPHSFPSGHATRAVLLSVVAFSLGPAWFGWLLAAWTPLVCISRVMTGLHFISDILGGALLGLLMGLLVVAASPLLIRAAPFLF